MSELQDKLNTLRRRLASGIKGEEYKQTLREYNEALSGTETIVVETEEEATRLKEIRDWWNQLSKEQRLNIQKAAGLGLAEGFDLYQKSPGTYLIRMRDAFDKPDDNVGAMKQGC